MSIITDTLNRLETDTPALAANSDRIHVPSRIRNSLGFPLKALTMATLLLFAGTSLMVWFLDSRPGGSTGLSLAIADTGEQMTKEPMPIRQPLPEPFEEQPDKSETAVLVDLPAASPAQSPTAELTATSKPETQANESPTHAPLDEKPLAVAYAKDEVVGSPSRTEKPASAQTVSNKQQQVEPVQPMSAGTQSAPDTKTGPTASPDPAEEQTSPGPEMAKVKKRTPSSGVKEQAVASRPSLTEAGSVTGKPDSKATASPLKVAKVEPGTVEAKVTKSRPRKKVSVKKQKTSPAVDSGKATQTSSVDAAVERAQLALSRGAYSQALAALEALSTVPERRADFWLMQGSAHLGLGQLELAEKAFLSAQPLAPGNVQIAIQLAILKQEKGDHVSALQILDDAAISHPNVPEVFLNKGYSQQVLGNVRDAGHSFRIFLRMTEGRSLYAEQRKAVNEWLAQLYTMQE